MYYGCQQEDGVMTVAVRPWSALEELIMRLFCALSQVHPVQGQTPDALLIRALLFHQPR